MTFSSYEEFWPYYVAMHSRAATRWIHLTGTLTGLALTTYGLARGRKRKMIRMMLAGRDTELGEIARKWLAENPCTPVRSRGCDPARSLADS
ncbi:Mpo1-like protein [Streptomyces sp. H34-S4]|uniref:Mpo1-like protein n=1 Tax=Streptomyces sp. H34-S4 TaxID=2996463 RepID=UPI00226D5367|nr:Mpo1-like protein [Streptomyces sp. H34-S4]MCY0938486.1 DUF962 domain-containing protein [Streptomyces sp. H34-S4]